MPKKISHFLCRKIGITSKAGFTLFELLVSISIIAVVSGIVFFNHSKFKSDTQLTNFAYRLALAIREAQVYSISVKQFNVGETQKFNIPYGIHLKEGVQDSFIFFADAQVADERTGEPDGVYTVDEGTDTECDTEADSECVEKTTIGQGILIKGWCGIYWNGPPGSQDCFPKDGNLFDHFLDISFRRPNPDAIFSLYEYYYEPLARISACVDNNGESVPCTGWAICLVAPGGRQKQVVVYETGQISVQNVIDGSVGCGSL